MDQDRCHILLFLCIIFQNICSRDYCLLYLCQDVSISYNKLWFLCGLPYVLIGERIGRH